MNLEELKYPIGKFSMPEKTNKAMHQVWLNDLAILPGRLESETATLNDKQLDTPYRPGGWTTRQLVHHIADSHLNAFCRIKLTLTEDSPTIKPYEEGAWAAMSDYTSLPIDSSLNILRGLHPRMVYVLKNLSDEAFQKYYVHPEYGKTYSLEAVLGLYAWHSNHHLSHILALKKRMDWA